MLNNKEKIIKLKEKRRRLLHLILKGFSCCMCFASVFFLLMGFLFFITGDQNIFFIKNNFGEPATK
ncbi:MAG: hypothetical protein D3906_07090 [Candidatus Electrothrix sp. AUS1_2]|nr:hypothetical protein [Candidatus Electrothrix sp. AUS1_2]